MKLLATLEVPGEVRAFNVGQPIPDEAPVALGLLEGRPTSLYIEGRRVGDVGEWPNVTATQAFTDAEGVSYRPMVEKTVINAILEFDLSDDAMRVLLVEAYGEIIDAQADLQSALGVLRHRNRTSGTHFDIENWLARSLARLHRFMGKIGSPMAQPATHPDIDPSA